MVVRAHHRAEDLVVLWANGGPDRAIRARLAANGSAEAAAEPVTITGTNTATFRLPLPNFPGLIGLRLYLQGSAVAPGYNPGEVLVSNGVHWTIGNT